MKYNTNTNKNVKMDKDDKPNFDEALREHAKKFYDIMRKTSGYVNCDYLFKEFDKAKMSIKNDPHVLWNIWRYVEAVYPCAIDFIPQSHIFWRSRPSGWRFMGPVNFEKARRKNKK